MSDAPLVVVVQASAGMRGPQRTAAELAGWLSRRREVLVASPDGWIFDELARRAPDASSLVLPGERSADRVSSARLLSRLAKRRRVLFHANGLSAFNLVGPAAIRTRAPVLVHFHAFALPSRARWAAQAWLRGGADVRFHAVSDFARGLLEATALRRAVGDVLPNAFDVAAYAVERSPAERIRVGFVGGADPRKGLLRFIRIAGACRDLDLDWRIFGVSGRAHDAYVDRCRKEAAELGVADRLSWVGTVSEPRQIYGSVDLVVIASELESFCRVAAEAMLSGLPVVATRIPGLSEIVWDGVTGLLFDRRRPEEGGDLVRALATDDALRLRLSNAARDAGPRFDVRRIGQQLEGLYGELVPQEPGRIPAGSAVA